MVNKQRPPRSRRSRRTASATSSRWQRGRRRSATPCWIHRIALAAWLLDHDTDSYYKIAGAFVDGKPTGNLTREQIIDNITLYWLTGTAASAARSYWEDARALAASLASGQPPPPVSVPVGFTTFPGEIWATPRSWAEAAYPDLAYFNEVEKGGHFAAWEEPELFFDEVGRRSGRCARGMRVRTSDPLCRRSTGRPSGSTPSRSAPPSCAGRVVLVNFWTLTCINWLRQEPYVRAWSQAYRDDGLVVIGVHTPEFSFEHEIDRVRRATKERGIDYPVAVDNDYAIWSAFDNHYWPALYFIDRDGDHPRPPLRRRPLRAIGAHHPAAARRRARARLRRRARRGGRGRLGPPRTPETYLGYGRDEASPHRTGPLQRRDELPEHLRSTTGRSPASGRSGARTSCSTRPAAASPAGFTRATRISCSPPAARQPIPLPRAPRRRGSRPVARRGRRRGRQRGASGRPHVPARARARRGPRADAGDHVPRARRRGVRVHVRVEDASPGRLGRSWGRRSEPEAELLCSVLRGVGHRVPPRLTNSGAGAGDGLGTPGRTTFWSARRTRKRHATCCSGCPAPASSHGGSGGADGARTERADGLPPGPHEERGFPV